MTMLLKILTAILIPAALVARGADNMRLETNATLRFEFPDLPDTLATMVSGEKQPPRLTAQLPKNYSQDRSFPLFVLLDGYHGGRGDNIPRFITGSRDFICVNMPLFKVTYDQKGNMIVRNQDFALVSRAYRIMLQKLFDAVPNISTEGSVWGGFSNGAHTTGVLLEGRDEFVLRHFRAFYLVEGGFDHLSSNVLNQPLMKGSRLLIGHGDQAEDKTAKSLANHAAFVQLANAVESSAREARLDVTSVVMRGYGHEWPAKLSELVDKWIRKEKLPEIEKK